MLSISYARRVAISLPARRRTVRPADGSTFRRRGRLPLVMLVVACLTAVGAAVSAAGAVPPGLTFAQVGHWIANPRQSLVFHVNGAGGVDARVHVPGLAPDSQAVQGPVSGYVVGPRSITPYGKDDLRVEQRIPPPAVDETPVAIEARGGPYLVYRDAGSVVRLGDERPTVSRLGTRLGEPAVTRDGTLWLHLPGRNRLCHLAPDADDPTCVAETRPGHRGALTVVGDGAAFVDLDDDTIAPLDAGGLGRPRGVGLDLPADALVARCDVGGRIAVVDPGAGRLNLIDASGLGTGRAAAVPVSVSLPAGGDHAPPMAGRSSVVVLDRTGHRLSVYDVRTGRLRVQRLPAEGGTPRLSRGEDEHVYVDGGEGEHLLVVDDAGRVTAVRLGDGAAAAPGPGGQPAPPGSDRPQSAADARNRRAGDPTPPAGGRPRSGTPAPRDSTRPEPVRPDPIPPGPIPPGPIPPGPIQPGPTQPGSVQPGPEEPGQGGPGPVDPGPGDPGPVDPGPTLPAPPPATPPGMPSELTAVAGNTDVVVNWAAAADNGEPIEAYHVTWTPATHGGAVTVNGRTRSTTLAGLVPTTRYTVTVTAQNSVGRGTPRSVEVVSPSRSMFAYRGAPTTWAPDCLPPDCTFVNLELRGFPPNTEVDIVPWTDEWGQFNGGATLTTDDEGTLIVDDRFPCNNVRHYVWLVVDGIPTNRVYWAES